MEGKPKGFLSGHQDWETELTEMLEGVVLPEMSGVHEQCIYIVPQNIRQANPKAYTPQAVSIGPFHKPGASGGVDNIFVHMEELKLKYLKGFLSRTTVSMGEIVLKLKEWEIRIRSCYAGPVNYNSNDFLKMILIDVCFIIEHFLRCCQFDVWKESDPILSQLWLVNDIRKDLILLENQLPFFLLDDIYNLAGMNNAFPSFLKITFFCLRYFNNQKINLEGVYPKHFTDLLRTSMLPPSFVFGTTKEKEIIGNLYSATQLSVDLEAKKEKEVIRHLYSATQLSEAGLVFKAIPEGKSLLDLEFRNGVLTMPCFHVHDSTEIYMRNLLAFEECHNPQTRYLAQYFTILNFLIKTEKDVKILVDKKIIVNWMGDPNAVPTMVNNLCTNIFMPFISSKYFILCKSLNGFYENPRNKYKAIFIQEGFTTAWKIASAISGVFIILLTLIQTLCSVISVIRGK